MVNKRKYYYKIFLNFLKKNDCFDNFKNNWYNLEKFRCNRYCERANNNPKIYFLPLGNNYNFQNYRYIIFDSFSWIESPEGLKYWQVIDKEWRKYSNNIINADTDFFTNKEEY